jgi:hypothetical protein
MTATVIGLALLALNVSLAVRYRPAPFHFALALLSASCLGFVAIGLREEDNGPAAIYVAGLFGLSAAYWLGRLSLDRAARARPVRPAEVATMWGLGLVGIFLAALVIYHYAKVGVPLLASDIETRRFAFTESGLFGLPSRAVLFGVVVYFFACWGFSWLTASAWPVTALTVFSFGLLAATRLASGFRSSLLELVLYVALATVLAAGAITWRRFAKLYSVPIAVAVLFAVVLGGRYETVVSQPADLETGLIPTASRQPEAPAQPAVASMQPGESALAPREPESSTTTAQSLQSRVLGIAQRATGGSAEPGYLVITRRVGLPKGETSLVNDVRYYIPRYLQLTPDSFPFVKIVSAQLYGTALSRDSFIVPVTIGALPALVYDFALLGMLIFCSLGALYAFLERLAIRTGSPFVFAGIATGLVALTDYLTKGDLLFEVLNWSAMVILLGVVFAVTRLAVLVIPWPPGQIRPRH